MLQRFLLITLTLCSLTATAQWQQTGSKVRYVNGLGIPTKDTVAGVAADSSQIVIRPADSALYIKYKRTWLRVGGGGGSIAGGGTAGQVSFFTSASAIGGDNGLVWDNANKRLGINTVTPGKNLDIHGTNIIAQFNGTGTNNAYLDFQNAGSTQWRIGNQYAAAVNRYSIFNAAGASEIFTALQNGNIGIGLSSPAYKLDVNGTARVASRLDIGITGGTDGVNITRAASGQGLITSWAFTPSDPIAGISSGANFGFNGSTNFYGMGLGSLRNSAYDMWFQTGTANGGGYRFYIGTSEKMTMFNTGNFAINTTTDNGVDKLQVNGSGSFTGGVNMATSSGNVGIGTTSPAHKLSVLGGNLLVNNGTSPDANSGIRIVAPISTTHFNWMIAAQQNVTNTFEITPSTAAGGTTFTNPALAITSGGNVGVGYTAPAAKLAVSGTTLINTNTDNGVDKLQVNGSMNVSTLATTNNLSVTTNATVGGTLKVTGTTTLGTTNTGALNASSLDVASGSGTFANLYSNGLVQMLGVNVKYRNISATYTATTGDDYFINITSGTFTLNLPTAATPYGQVYVIKNSGAGTVTLDPFSTETIDGSTTVTMNVQNQTYTIIGDGTNWKIVSKYL